MNFSLEKENKLLLGPKSCFFSLSLPVEKEIITNIHQNILQIGELSDEFVSRVSNYRVECLKENVHNIFIF